MSNNEIINDIPELRALLQEAIHSTGHRHQRYERFKRRIWPILLRSTLPPGTSSYQAYDAAIRALSRILRV